MAEDQTGVIAMPATKAGAIESSGVQVVTAIRINEVIEGAGNGNAPSVSISVDIADGLLPDIVSVRVGLFGPDGSFAFQRANADNGDDLENFVIDLPRFAVSGRYEVFEVQVNFAGDPAVTGFPEDGLVLTEDEVSSLISTRFVDLVNIDQDITAPVLTDLLLPTRSILVDNDLPGIIGGGNSAEITFQGEFSDEASGLNIIEFEFDIGPGSPAVIGAAVGLLGDLSNGVRQLSTFNTEAPAGNFIFELLRVSDDQNNTLILTADDIAGLGFQNSVHIVSQADIQDASSPSVNAFELGSNTVTINQGTGKLDVTLNATDEGFDATGVQTLTLVLTNDLGSRYQLEADVTFGVGSNATASFSFPRDFPAGEYVIQRISVNDGAFNREDIALEDRSLSVINPEGGDVGDNRLRAGDEDSVIVARSGADTVIGGAGADNLSLGDGDDISFAGQNDTGDDTVVGGSGNDVIGGGAGSDFIIGGRLITVDTQTLLFRDLEIRLDGADTLFGGSGDDIIYGGSPRFEDNDPAQPFINDLGSVAADVIYSGIGDDFVQGSYGDDIIGGSAGADTLRGGSGHDTIFGGRGGVTSSNDQLFGEDGDDLIFASDGNDLVNGGADNDTIFGGNGADTLNGAGGQDQIYGGAGEDILSGGSGRDVFFFVPGSGADQITDFDVLEDTLFLSEYSDRFSNVAEIRNNARLETIDGQIGLLIDLGEGDQIFIHNLTSVLAVEIQF